MQVLTDEAADERLAQARAEVDAMRPPVQERNLLFNLVMPDDTTRQDVEVVQEMLGYYPVQEFTTIMGEIIDKFVKGEFGMKLGELFSGKVKMPQDYTPETVNKTVEENMQLIQAFLEAVRIIPGLQQDIMCLSLGIPPEQRPWFKKAISRPPSQGGLTVDEGFDILIWFIRQNSDLIKRFFSEKVAEVVAEFQQHALGREIEAVLKTDDVQTDPATAPKTTAEEETGTSDSPGSTPLSTSSPATQVSVS